MAKGTHQQYDTDVEYNLTFFKEVTPISNSQSWYFNKLL